MNVLLDECLPKKLKREVERCVRFFVIDFELAKRK
jgi:hypothetical protein